MELLKDKLSSIKTSDWSEYQDFFESFKLENDLDDDDGLLPPEAQEQFLAEFQDAFDMNDTLNNEIASAAGSNLSTPKSETPKKKVIDGKTYPVWKEILRQGYPSFKCDGTTEKRIRVGISLFLEANCAKFGVNAWNCLPQGNSARQYLIPEEMTDDFVAWIKEEEKADFRKFEVKRKSASGMENTSNKKQRIVSSSQGQHDILDLSIKEPKKDFDLKLFKQ